MSDDRDAFCQWIKDRGLLKCSRCGRTVAAVAGSRDPLAICPDGSPITGKVVENGHYAFGLGDYVASALNLIGFTKERVSAAAGRDCGCAARQQAMNEWGKKNLGIG